MKRNYYIAGALILILLFSYNLVSRMSSQDGTDCEVTTAEFQELDLSEASILDVRTQSEYNQGHVKNAILIDVKKSSFEEDIKGLNKDKPYYVYCKSGIRSARAIRIMKSQGFNQLCEIEGGIQGFMRAGIDLEK